MGDTRRGRWRQALRTRLARPSAENTRLLDALRERQVLLERLSSLQRSIVERRALHDVLDSVVDGARELLGDDVALLRMAATPDARGRVAASVGVPGASDAEEDVGAAPARLGARAMREERLVIADAVTGADAEALAGEFGRSGMRAAIAAPVVDEGGVAGSLAVGSANARREYDARDQQVLLAFAEHASLALNHARAVDEATHEAFHDGLTGLPNRSLFVDRLEHALARAERTGTPAGVLFCDLDGFKTVNDSLGHAAGDRLLVAVAERLRECVRPADTVARLGGDEFAVLLEELREPGDAARAAQRILEALETPFELGTREVLIGTSIGIAAGTREADTLLRDADLAMYRAKGEGRGRYALFEPGLHTAIVERLELELDLKGAVERGELELVYQPILSLRTGAVVAMESLVRWRHPTRGLVQPDRFIPLAEESGQILDLGRWVLGEACRQAALWRARYPGYPGLQVGVNVSGVQLGERGLVGDVAAALEAAQLDPEALTLEITESVLMTDAEVASRRLADLKRLGVDLAIDDFGTGYSSLTYLQRFPLDNLKIERAFVERIGSDGEDPALLRAIVDLAEIFGLRPIAEGIERQRQRERLLELGCELGQGHLFAEPLSAADADALLLRSGLLGAPPTPPAPAPHLGSPAHGQASAADPRAGGPPAGGAAAGAGD